MRWSTWDGSCREEKEKAQERGQDKGWELLSSGELLRGPWGRLSFTRASASARSMTVVGVDAPHSHHFAPRHSSEGDRETPRASLSFFQATFSSRAMAADWVSCPRGSKEGTGRLTAKSIPDLEPEMLRGSCQNIAGWSDDDEKKRLWEISSRQPQATHLARVRAAFITYVQALAIPPPPFSPKDLAAMRVGVGAVLTKTASTAIKHTGTRGSVIGVGGASPWIPAAGRRPMLHCAASFLKPRLPASQGYLSKACRLSLLVMSSTRPLHSTQEPQKPSQSVAHRDSLPSQPRIDRQETPLC